MKREVPVVAAVAVIVIIIGIVCFLVVRAGKAGSSTAPLSQTEKSTLISQARDAMSRTGGDVSRMTPSEKSAYEDALKRGLITNPFMMRKQNNGMPGGGAGAQGYPPSNMTRPPQGYPPSNMSGPPQGYPPSNMSGPPQGYPPSNMTRPPGGSAPR